MLGTDCSCSRPPACGRTDKDIPKAYFMPTLMRLTKLFCVTPFLVTLFSVTLFSAALPSAHAGDPLQWGPYKVGVKTEILVDGDRQCAITGKPRTLVTEFWYPATEDADSKPLNQFSDFWVSPAGVIAGNLAIGAFGGNFAKTNETFKNVARRDAALKEGNFPLLVFSHGNGGFRHQNTYQAEFLASHGYVVAAPDHTGNSAISILPDQVLPYNKDTRKAERRDDRPHDVSFLITHLLEQSAADDNWLSGRLDPVEVGVFGHSFGGFTSCRATELDDRIKAIIPMTLAGTVVFSAEDNVGEECSVPLMVILGDTDRTVGEAGNERSIRYFEQATGDKYLLNFKDAGHYTFTEMPQINPDFGDGVGVERDDDGTVTLTFSDTAEDQRITNAYSVAFFDAFLKHDSDAQTFLNQDHFPEELDYRRK